MNKPHRLIAPCLALILGATFALSASASGLGTSLDTDTLDYKLHLQATSEEGLDLDLSLDFGGLSFTPSDLEHLQTINPSAGTTYLGYQDLTLGTTQEWYLEGYNDHSYTILEDFTTITSDNLQLNPNDSILEPDGNTPYWMGCVLSFETGYFTLLTTSPTLMGFHNGDWNRWDEITMTLEKIDAVTGQITSTSRTRTDTHNLPANLSAENLLTELGRDTTSLYKLSLICYSREFGGWHDYLEIGFSQEVYVAPNYASITPTLEPASGVVISADYDNFDLLGWLGQSLDSFVSAKLFTLGDVDVSVGTVLGFALAVPIFVAFLRKFAGG